MTRNAPPAHVWDALRRLLQCNKTELAARLGVAPRTLRHWEALTEQGESAGKAAEERASQLMVATLRAARDADVHAQWAINWDAVARIGGRR